MHQGERPAAKRTPANQKKPADKKKRPIDQEKIDRFHMKMDLYRTQMEKVAQEAYLYNMKLKIAINKKKCQDLNIDIPEEPSFEIDLRIVKSVFWAFFSFFK